MTKPHWQLIGELAGALNGFRVYDDVGYEREPPADVQKAIADAVTCKWIPYPGHFVKREEICQGVVYCLRLRVLDRADGKTGRQPPEGERQLPNLFQSASSELADETWGDIGGEVND